MKIGIPLNYAGGFDQTVEELQEYEDVGLDIVMMPEAYSFDSVSQLGFLAAKTHSVLLSSNILNIYSRTPTLLAMTAAGLDYVSGGRFVLGLGASGPQVVEGFHGVAYDKPLARTREVLEVCRQVWRREKVDFHGEHVDIPLTPERGGTGLGKPLKLINHPVRSSIPVFLAALGPRNVSLAAELFEGWQPVFFYPELARDAFGASLDDGLAERSNDLPELEVTADTRVLITEDPDELERGMAELRAHVALYVGGMGARGKNFYHQLAVRYGFGEAADRVQDLYLSGRKDEAAAALPEELVKGVCLVGTPDEVAERVVAFAAAGVTTLNAQPIAGTHEHRVKDVAALKEFAG
ncbi:LLM class F420-dependent oxidoreductase [Nocardioides sp.]|uniref:LLM class F420-dependent oxidoreductase n=1 Tax=Nocardioides sp. TaxID=35761 RepID=UPI003219154F